MINQGNNVPDKTIAVFVDKNKYTKPKENVLNILKRSEVKRDWFDSHFYRCLPLTIGNQYGFTIALEYDLGIIWDGTEDPSGIKFMLTQPIEEVDKLIPNMSTHFGSGIVTVNPPLVLRTPPGVNLMTINPPNHVLPNITVMTGVVEADNLRRNFTFNLKIQIPNLEIFIPKGTPIAAFIPIPRYYADSFELKFADDLFDEAVITEENKAALDADIYRTEVEPKLKDGVSRHYYTGQDVYGNKFPDHQKP